MKKDFKISIPKPCHEDWNTMTPNQKGRFCSSCKKTVVDFTKKSHKEIQEYVEKNQGKQICGHFYQRQLSDITIQIPNNIFTKKLSFQNLFIISLLITMGTTLFSCKTHDGKTQRIQKVELVNNFPKTNIKPNLKCDTTDIIEGEIEITPIEGELELDDIGKEEVIEDALIGYIVQNNARFKEAKEYSEIKARKHFNEQIKNLFIKHFEKPQKTLSLRKGRHKLTAVFKVDKFGTVINIKILSSNKDLEKESYKVIEKIPNLIPAMFRNRKIESKYSLPITFEIK